MYKIKKVQLTKDERVEMEAISDKGEVQTFELLVEDLPMIVQMLVAAQQQKIRNDSKKEGSEPKILLNYVEGWQVFELPEDMPKGVGLHFQCAGGFDFAFAITEQEGEHSPKSFQNDLNSLMQAIGGDPLLHATQ